MYKILGQPIADKIKNDLNEKLKSILLVGSMMASEDERFLLFGLQFDLVKFVIDIQRRLFELLRTNTRQTGQSGFVC